MEFELVQDQAWWRRNREKRLFSNTPVKQRIYEMLKRAGLNGATTREIMDVAYMHDPDGGPESGNVISVHVRQMNKVLSEHGLRIRSTMGPGATYHLEGELK